MSDEKCRYLEAAYPDLSADDTCTDHRHEDRVFTLARAFAAGFQGDSPTDEQIGWFIDDADAVVDDFDPTPDAWDVVRDEGFPAEHGLVCTLTVNGMRYVIQDSDWEPAHPVRRDTWESWVSEDDDDA